MTRLTLSDGRTGLPGRHREARGAAAWFVRRLHPADFVQAILVVGLILVLWPTTFGGRFGIVVVAGTSMEPTYMLGDALVTWRQPAEVGDVILFQVPEGQFGEGNPVIHRVIDLDESGWVTQGDNMFLPDEWTPSSRDVLGVVQFRIPLGGRVLAIVTSWLFFSVIGGLAVGLLLWPDSDAEEQRKGPYRSSSSKVGPIPSWVRRKTRGGR